MSGQRYTPEFKNEAVRQVVERGYSVTDIAQRLGVSKHSLYKWVNAVTPDKSESRAEELVAAKSEILKLRSQMRRLAKITRAKTSNPLKKARKICLIAESDGSGNFADLFIRVPQ